jgi:8-oxo-dGTP pyrophosphatase MutT (NUDIX family)
MSEKRGNWVRLSSKTIHKNPYYSVSEDSVIKPDGSEGIYNVTEFNGAVFVVAMDKASNIYLVAQWRYTNNNYSLEVPCGHIDKNEKSLVAAKRELKEETGLVADKWESLGFVYPANGILSGKHYVFIAMDLHETADNAQVEEGITSMQKASLTEIFQKIKVGEISDSDTISAITLAALYLGLIK